MFKSVVAALSLCFALGTFSAQAQVTDRRAEQSQPTKKETPDAVALTREMSQRLRLNEVQYMKLLNVNRTKLSSINSIKHLYNNDETMRAQKMSELEAQYEQECSRILTPSQLSQLQQQQGTQPSTAPVGTGNGLG